MPRETPKSNQVEVEEVSRLSHRKGKL